MPPTFDAEAELRRHGASLRTLANALLGDRDAADDVVQATWLRAIEQPPQHDAAPGGWLATVVRNFALRWRRAERRRRCREELAARSEAMPDAAGSAAREELLQRVVDALRSLPQPYRGALWMRYFEDLPPAVIAARTGVPVATVKSRLQRGLVQLRTRFDREGGQGDWRAGLAIAFGVEGSMRIGTMAAAGVLGVLTMTKTKLLVTTGIMLLMLAGALVWWPDASAPGSSQPGDSATRVETAQAGLAAEQASTPGLVEEVQRVVVAPETAVTATTGTLLVRAIGSKGAPAAGETLIVARKGEGGPFGQRLQRTDAAGQARFEGLVPGTMTVQLLQHEHSTTAAIRAGEVTDLEFVLPDGLTVRGLVVDAEERPLAGAEVALFQFNSESTAVVATTDADGRFTLRHALPMSSFLFARTVRHAASRYQNLQGSDGGAVDVVIQLLDAGGVVAGVVLGPDGRPVCGAEVQVGISGLEGVVKSTGMTATAVPVHTGEDGRFRAIGLAAGEQPVFVRAAGLVPWRGACVVNEYATTAMRIDLIGGVTCTGIVRDATGAPVAGADVRPRGLDGALWCWTESTRDGAFTLSGLEPGTIELRASHDELGKGSARFIGAAGAIVSCELPLSRGIELRGRVLDDAGAPWSDVWVRATAGKVSSETRTDAAGRFVLANCPEGLFRVTAERGQHMAQLEQVDPRRGEVELRLPRKVAAAATVRIRGRIVGPDGQPVAGTQVHAYGPGNETGREQATAADGSFEFEPVPPGTWHVYLPPQLLPGFSIGPRELAANEVWDLGSIQLVAGGTATVQVQGTPPGTQLDFHIRNRDMRPFGARWLGDGLLRTVALAPGEYYVQFWCDGFARRLVPFTIRAGEDTRVDTQLAPGIRQRLEFVRADGKKVSHLASHSLFCGDEALIHRHFVYGRDAPVYALDGAMTANLWLEPGAYRLEAKDEAASGLAQFTVGEREGPPVRIVLR